MGIAQSVEHRIVAPGAAGSIPVTHLFRTNAGVAELADASDLGSGAFGRGGSIPFIRISLKSVPVIISVAFRTLIVSDGLYSNSVCLSGCSSAGRV